MINTTPAIGFGVQPQKDGSVVLYMHPLGGPGLALVVSPDTAGEMAEGIKRAAAEARMMGISPLPRLTEQNHPTSPPEASV